MTRLIIALFALSLPLLEIAGFVIVGRRIGVGPTLLLVLVSAIVGMMILRRQGFQAVTRLRQGRFTQDLPVEGFLNTAMVLLAGLLLIVPGFVTDAIALILLLPFVRKFLSSRLAGRFVVVNMDVGPDPSETKPQPPRTIDLDTDDYRRDDPR